VSETTRTGPARKLDVDRVPFGRRKETITGALDALLPGQALLLVSEHMPLPLRIHLEQSRPGEFHWTYVAWGRPEWRIQIARVRSPSPAAAAPATGG
jgi:uncharacterized protein (DUF2249 family)